MTEREQWKSGLGFVLAAAGSAVGLGNLWGFAYRASEGGGGAFVLLYVAIVLLVCLPLLSAEMVLGRSTGRSPLMAPAMAGGKIWGPLGWLFCFVSVGILSYYVVLMGYTGSTLINTLLGTLPVDKNNVDQYFSSIITGRVSVLGQLISLFLTGLVVSSGVRKGIEKLTSWGVPLLLFMLIALAIWSAFQPGAFKGYDFLFGWDASQLKNPVVISNAFRQAFFSIGTGIGAILAYSTYLKRRSNIPREASAVVALDTAVALIAGCVTFPMIAIFGLEKPDSAGAVGVLFKVLPHGLAKTDLWLGSSVIAFVFFALIYIAAITSSISLLEVPVSSLMDKLGLTRTKAVWISVLVLAIVGLPSALDISFLDKADQLMTALLICAGFFLTLLMAWVVPNRYKEDLASSETSSRTIRNLLWSLRWISTPVISIGLVVVLEETIKNW
tara:strand:- start:202 stop:1527 length:1326 start_codon:yes stop_codon:yes gene_type:complete